MTDIHRVIAGDADPLVFADDLFLWLPDDPPAPPELREHARETVIYEESEMAPALLLATYTLIVADHLNNTIASAPFFQATAEAEIATKMLHQLAQWLAGEHHDPIPAAITNILEEITELLHAIYDHYEDDWNRAGCPHHDQP